MERIHYAGSSFLTGDLIARALIDYAHFLTAHHTSAAVDIPVRRADGTTARANFLLVPTSQIVSESELSDYGEIFDDELVLLLRQRAVGRQHTLTRPVMSDASFDAFTYSDLVEMA